MGTIILHDCTFIPSMTSTSDKIIKWTDDNPPFLTFATASYTMWTYLGITLIATDIEDTYSR